MRKLMALLLSVVLCLSLITLPAAAATSTSDKQTLAASALNMMGALQGDGSGSLNLDGTLTRAQFCKIAVVVEGLSKTVSQYSGYTIFPDVPATSWQAGYVNVAVRSAGIMTGYSDGNFGPDDTMTFGQAVTVLMKMLGYTASDVGVKWPDSYISKADQIGLLDGLSLSANDAVSRGSAAVLFVNLLNTQLNGSTSKFMTKVSGATVVSNVFLVSSNATADDGTTGAVKIAGAASGTYLPVNVVPEALQGVYGSLILNASGKALVMVPEKSGKTVVSTVSSTTAGYIKCADGTKVTMNSTASFYLNGTAATYGDTWTDISGGMLVSAYYNEGGAVQCVLVADAESVASSVMIAGSDGYALSSTSDIYLNGVKATTSDIEKYDVIAENVSGLYSVTRNRVTGICEDAYPSSESPSTIKVLGKVYTVLSGTTSNISTFSVGDKITLLLSSDNEVAGVVPAATLATTNYGVVTSISSTTATVKLTSGYSISGTLSSSSSSGIYVGNMVSVASYGVGYITLSPISEASSGYAFDVSGEKLGSMSLSKAVKIYDSVAGSAVTETKLSNILVSSLDSSKIRFYATDPAGKVSLLVLNNGTGDAYTYGFLDTTVVTTNGTFTVSNKQVTVENGDGTTTAILGSVDLVDGTPVGIASTGNDTLAGYVALTSIASVSRSNFQQDSAGVTYVSTSIGVIRVSDDVQVYISGTDTWTTLARARSYSDSLTVYYDKTPSTGGKVRVIVA